MTTNLFHYLMYGYSYNKNKNKNNFIKQLLRSLTSAGQTQSLQQWNIILILFFKLTQQGNFTPCTIKKSYWHVWRLVWIIVMTALRSQLHNSVVIPHKTNGDWTHHLIYSEKTERSSNCVLSTIPRGTMNKSVVYLLNYLRNLISFSSKVSTYLSKHILKDIFKEIFKWKWNDI